MGNVVVDRLNYLYSVALFVGAHLGLGVIYSGMIYVGKTETSAPPILKTTVLHDDDARFRQYHSVINNKLQGSEEAV